MQHTRLVTAPGLKIWSRFTFVQGIMAYAASPLWLLLLVTSIAAALFPNQPNILPGFADTEMSLWTLGIAVAAILVLPKVLILLRGMLDGRNRAFGGTGLALASVLAEIVLSTLLAPTMLMLQSRAVAQVVLGLDGGWPATKRGQNWIGLGDAFRASWWIVAFASFALIGTMAYAPAAAIWVAPAMLPALLAPLLISLTSRPSASQLPLLFRTPGEVAPSAVVMEQRAILTAWSLGDTPVEMSPLLTAARKASHVPA